MAEKEESSKDKTECINKSEKEWVERYTTLIKENLNKRIDDVYRFLRMFGGIIAIFLSLLTFIGYKQIKKVTNEAIIKQVEQTVQEQIEGLDITDIIKSELGTQGVWEKLSKTTSSLDYEQSLRIPDRTRQEIENFFTQVSKTIQRGEINNLNTFFSPSYDRVDETIQGWKAVSTKIVIFHIDYLASAPDGKIIAKINATIKPAGPNWSFFCTLQRDVSGKWKIIG